MSKTSIQWCDYTLNPFVGCTPVSAGCANCYAARVAAKKPMQRLHRYQGTVDEHGHWTGKVNFVPEALEKLLKIKKPCRVFMPSMSDPFHPDIPDEWLDAVFAAIALVPHVEVMMLTKRPLRASDYIEDLYARLINSLLQPPEERGKNLSHLTVHRFPLENLWIGVSVENQILMSERVTCLGRTLAAKRFISYEPALEKIDFRPPFFDYLRDIDLVICGGESGKGARPFELNWARSLAEQCRQGGVEFFLKQLGSKPVDNGVALKLGHPQGGDPREWPEDLREHGAKKHGQPDLRAKRGDV